MIPLPPRDAHYDLDKVVVDEAEPVTNWFLALRAGLPGSAPPGTSAVAPLRVFSVVLTWSRHRLYPIRLVGCVVRHTMGPHLLFWFVATVVTSPLVLSVAFVLIVVAWGTLWTIHREAREVRDCVQRLGWRTLVSPRSANGSGMWPLRGMSALLGWIAMTGYCTWRFSIDYYYAFYSFWDHGLEWVLGVWLVPSAVLSLILFVISVWLSALPTASRPGCGCVFFVPVSAVLTTRSWWWYRVTSLTLLSLLLSQLYYAYQLAALLLAIDTDLSQMPVRDAATRSLRAQHVSASSASSGLGGAFVWLPRAVYTLLRPPRLVFAYPHTPVFWRVACLYTTLGLMAGIVCTALGLIYPLWKRRPST